MLPLCSILHITVNDLLTGARVSESDYQEKAEENMMNLMRENAENRKSMMLSIICGAITIIAVTALVVIAAYLDLPVIARVLLISRTLAITGRSRYAAMTTSAVTAIIVMAPQIIDSIILFLFSAFSLIRFIIFSSAFS